MVAGMLCKSVKKRPEVNELLQHPAVVPWVQRYLDRLSSEGPGGWMTWRMKLPTAVLAQMAQVLANAATANAKRPPSSSSAPQRAAPQRPPAPPSAEEDRDAAVQPRMPRHVEDMLSSTELIEGFSLQSLLDDGPPPPPKPAAAAAVVHRPPMNQANLLAATLHPDDLAKIRARAAPAATAEGEDLDPDPDPTRIQILLPLLLLALGYAHKVVGGGLRAGLGIGGGQGLIV